MTKTTIKADVIGAAGYTGGELIRLLVDHPNVELGALVSRSQAGMRVSEVHMDIVQNIHFTDSPSASPDITFLCMGHGKSREWLSENPIKGKIVDLSQDFRLKDTAGDFVYGLPEFQRNAIGNADKVANPGCFATCIQLALLQLASEGLLKQAVHVNGITGSTGAGQAPSATGHFSWRNNNISLYKVFNHQHLNEIGETLKTLQGEKAEVLFLPVRGNFTRGIFVSAYTAYEGPAEQITELYRSYYGDAAFTYLREEELHLKQVVNTNNCFVNVRVMNGQVLVTSIIDNLLKGASGQAVQNMNLMFGLDERAGLHLKSTYF